MKCNEDINICKSCGGMCCKTMGCHFSPKDFDTISVEYLKNMINRGYISIDWWDGDVDELDKYERVYFLRMRNKNGNIVDPSWGGQCILWTEEGCPFDWFHRPMGGKALVPNKNRWCETLYSKENCVRDWRKYWDILNELYEMYV